MSTPNTRSNIKGRHLFLIGIGILAVFYPPFLSCPVRHGPGVVAPDIPIQTKIKKGKPIYLEGFKINPVASFSIQARVLSRQRYRMDEMAKISPIDLALGWGPMSDERNLDELKISQSNRFYYWTTKKFPIPRGDIEKNSANMHLIPVDEIIKSDLLKVRKGQVIDIQGTLVNVESPKGSVFTTSKTRTDTGPGACEVILVRNFSVREDLDT